MAAILRYYTEDWRMFTVTAVRYTFVETPYGAWGATWDKACKSWDVFLSFNYIRIWGIHIGPNCYGLAVSVLSCLAAHCKLSLWVSRVYITFDAQVTSSSFVDHVVQSSQHSSYICSHTKMQEVTDLQKIQNNCDNVWWLPLFLSHLFGSGADDLHPFSRNVVLVVPYHCSLPRENTQVN